MVVAGRGISTRRLQRQPREGRDRQDHHCQIAGGFHTCRRSQTVDCSSHRQATRHQNGGGSRLRRHSRIREWATAQGYTVSARGRLPKEIVEAYGAAH
ncbi:Lsr2 family DNA-binding protein [Gordonia sp. NPDC003425]